MLTDPSLRCPHPRCALAIAVHTVEHTNASPQPGPSGPWLFPCAAGSTKPGPLAEGHGLPGASWAASQGHQVRSSNKGGAALGRSPSHMAAGTNTHSLVRSRSCAAVHSRACAATLRSTQRPPLTPRPAGCGRGRACAALLPPQLLGHTRSRAPAGPHALQGTGERQAERGSAGETRGEGATRCMHASLAGLKPNRGVDASAASQATAASAAPPPARLRRRCRQATAAPAARPGP